MFRNPLLKPSLAFFFLLSLLTTTGAAPAPGPKINISPPPGQAVWTVSFTYAKTRENLRSENKEALEAQAMKIEDLERIDKITYTIKAPVSSRITTFESGTKEEVFHYEGHEFFKPRNGKNVIKSDTSSYASAQELFMKKFPGVEWVKPKLFVKIETAFGESCAYFKEAERVLTAAQLATEDPNAVASSAREAWFSTTTGLPIAFKQDGATGKFNFGNPTSANVTVPQDIREAINKHAKFAEFMKKRRRP